MSDLPELLAQLETDKALMAGMVKRLASGLDKPLKVMEVCGTHTHAISRTGIRRALAGKVRLLSGPGCPVCVTSDSDIDKFIQLTEIDGLVVTTFGDMLHVPGSRTSLAAAKDKGADVRIVYSPLDVLSIAEQEPGKHFCFLGVGFETTAPAILATVAEARNRKIENFSIYAAFKLIPPALRLIASHPDISIDGFILPGHVSAILGTEPYRFLVDEYSKPSVVAGFEAPDILQALMMITAQLQKGKPELEIQYSRVVTPGGNLNALRFMDDMCVKADSEWRGLGVIPASGLKLKNQWKSFDVEERYELAESSFEKNPLAEKCRCGEVLLGKITPPDCPLFASTCSPSNPIGPCMVSSEGACSAYYKYER
ncbi:hydrogenase formation protein HypD [candidate division WOR-3 bacterium]|nr:hydrogenase formation protein HypD [candidate division WOR-3 bacterium]